MSRIAWSVLAPFCVVLAVLAVVTIVRENTREAPVPGENAPSLVAVVEMEGLTFSPATITVRKGVGITFDNNDVAPHTVTADDGSVDSGILDPGKAFRVAALDGFSYHCEIHPSMKAEVRLEG